MASRSHSSAAERRRLLPTTSATPCSTKCRARRRSPDDEMVPMMFRMMILALEDQTVCVRTTATARMASAAASSCPTAGLLPALTDAERSSTIVPAAPVDEPDRRRARRTATQPDLGSRPLRAASAAAASGRASATAIRTGRSGSGRARASTRAASAPTSRPPGSTARSGSTRRRGRGLAVEERRHQDRLVPR